VSGDTVESGEEVLMSDGMDHSDVVLGTLSHRFIALFVRPR